MVFLPVSPHSLPTSDWMFSRLTLQWTPFYVGQCKQKETKCYLVKTLPTGLCGRRKTAPISSQPSKTYGILGGLWDRATKCMSCELYNAWHPALSLSLLLIPAINLVPPEADCSYRKLLYFCPLIVSHS